MSRSIRQIFIRSIRLTECEVCWESEGVFYEYPNAYSTVTLSSKKEKDNYAGQEEEQESSVKEIFATRGARQQEESY